MTLGEESQESQEPCAVGAARAFVGKWLGVLLRPQ